MTRRILIRTALALVALYVVLAATELAVSRVALDNLREMIEKDLGEALGLEVEVADFRLSLLPSPRLRARELRVLGPPELTFPTVLEVDALEIGVAIWPLRQWILHVDSLWMEGARLYLEPDDAGEFGVNFAIEALMEDRADDPLELHVRHLEASGVEVFLRSGPTDAVRSIAIDELQLHSDAIGAPLAFATRGAYEGAVFELEGTLGALRELVEPTGPYPVRIAGRILDAGVRMEGTFREPLALTGLDLSVSIEVPDAVSATAGVELGALAVSAHLSDLDGTLGIERIDGGTVSSEPLAMSIEGGVDDLRTLQDVGIDADLSTRDLRFLQPLIGFPIPAVDSARLTLVLSDRDETLGLHGDLVVLAADERIEMRATGHYGDLGRLGDIDVHFTARAPDIATFAAWVGYAPRMPQVGPLEASGRLVERDGLIAAEDLELRAGTLAEEWAEVRGTVDDVIGRSGLEFHVELGAPSLDRFEPLLERPLPALEPVRAQALISDRDGSLGIESLRVEAGEKGRISVDLAAAIDDLVGRDEISADLTLEAPTLADVGALVGRDLPAHGPVEFAGRVRGSDEHFESEGFRLRVGESRLGGRARGSFSPGARPYLNANLHSTFLQVQDVEALIPPPPSIEVDSPEQPLPFHLLRALDLDLELRVDKLHGYGGLQDNELVALVSLEDGDLHVRQLSARYLGGSVQAELRVDASRPEPELVLAADVDGGDIGRLIAQFDRETTHQGQLDLDARLAARGRTLSALRRTLDGHFRVASRDGRAASQFSSDFVVNLAHAAFPGLEPDSEPTIGCAVLALAIEEGVGDVDGFLIRDGPITVTGSGTIDFAEGVYDLELEPTTSDPGILSVAPRVRVSGPLADPKFRPVRHTLGTSLGRGLLANLRNAGTYLVRPFRSRNEEIEAGYEACRLIGLTAREGSPREGAAIDSVANAKDGARIPAAVGAPPRTDP